MLERAWNVSRPDCHSTLLEHQRARAQCRNRSHIVAYEENRPAVTRDRFHSADAFLLESSITDSKHLVYDQDLWIEMGCNSESQPHLHTAGIALDRRVQEELHSAKIDDLIEPASDFAPRHSEDRTI